ncbi:hypothetical protein K435DRAFT_677039, partial [Dendrothele bispora CBS 962.96]
MQGQPLLEHTGVADPENYNQSGRSLKASALRNLVSQHGPDLILQTGNQPISEYFNTSLFPGMYPTLFPYGICGFEDDRRDPKLSLELQAEYLLDFDGGIFRMHWSFLFVIFNLIQRRKVHFQTHLAVGRRNFYKVARQISNIPSSTLLQLSKKIETEKSINNLTPSEKNAMSLLSQVKTITSHIPGSSGAKLRMRNEIKSYFGYFGMPHLYFTFNPSAVHSPLMQVIFGDESIDLDLRFPSVPEPHTRAIRVAADPVASADFFEFSWRALFSTLFGWDFDKNRSKPGGGVVGHIRAFYGTSE